MASVGVTLLESRCGLIPAAQTAASFGVHRSQVVVAPNNSPPVPPRHAGHTGPGSGGLAADTAPAAETYQPSAVAAVPAGTTGPAGATAAAVAPQPGAAATTSRGPSGSAGTDY